MSRGCTTLALALAAGCSPETRVEPVASRAETGPLAVYAVNAPLAYFARRIGARHVQVSFPAPPEVDPAFWAPTAEIVARYQEADLVLLSGAGYAGWVARATLRRRALVDTSTGFVDKLLSRDGSVTHTHGPDGEHSHADVAFTVWLDPQLALEQARAVAQAFARARPGYAPAFEANLAALEADLRALDARLADATQALEGRPLLFSHPVYAYFERRYELNGRSLHWEPDSMPNEREWRALAALRREHPAALLLWEAEPLPQIRARLAARGVQSVVYDPAGNQRADDWLTVMQSNAARLELFRTRRPD